MGRGPLIIAALGLAAATAAPAADLASIDLAKPFAARSPWRFTAAQGPDVSDPIMGEGEQAPGTIALCISKDGGRSCSPALRDALRLSTEDDLFAEPRYLNKAEVVRPRGGVTLLLVQVASIRSVNGNQRVATQLVAYDRARDSFAPIYAHQTGRNNNEEVRYIEDGRLQGAVVSAEPTDDAPFGYWITVSRLVARTVYRQVLRYRSATRYGDGNALAVIDSDMPGIQQRLGLWHAGMSLPVPARKCPNPRLARMELWCE